MFVILRVKELYGEGAEEVRNSFSLILLISVLCLHIFVFEVLTLGDILKLCFSGT